MAIHQSDDHKLKGKQQMKRNLCILGLLCIGPSFASAADIYVSGGYSSLKHDETRLSTKRFVAAPPGAPETEGGWVNNAWTTDEEEADVYQLAWGLAEDSARFAVEYSYQTSDFSGFDVDYTKHTLTYSGYWTPDLRLPELYRYLPRLHAVLGAGVGVGVLTLEGSAPEIGDDFNDRGLQLKLVAGLEYRITKSLALFATYEHHINEAYKDWVTETHEIVLDEGDQSGFMIGISGRFN
jgi:opacity protein-like surface antigen